MDGRKALGIKDRTGIPVVGTRADGVGSRVTEVAHRLPTRWAWSAALVGPVVATLCIALEPPPEPGATEPFFGAVLYLALVVSWAGAAFRAMQRHRSALGWASVVGLLSVAMTVACPTGGHHASVGAWWFGQLGISGGALALAVAARSRFRPRPVAAPSSSTGGPA